MSLPVSEALAMVRLRQWAVERARLRAGRAASYQRRGWQRRNARTCDAAQVRVLTFEQAFQRLSLDEQTALLATYCDGQSDMDAALVLGCSASKMHYLLPNARRHLAVILDRLGLL